MTVKKTDILIYYDYNLHYNNMPNRKEKEQSKFRISFKHKIVGFIGVVLLIILPSSVLIFFNTQAQNKIQSLSSNLSDSQSKSSDLESQLAQVQIDLDNLKNEDQYKRNEALQREIDNIQKTYNKAVVAYDDLVELSTKIKDPSEMEELFADILSKLAKREFVEADSQISELNKNIASEEAAIATAFVIPENVPVVNTPPGSGYSRQTVSIDIGQYLVSIVAADLGSTRVIVDTASTSDCGNDCPVLPLSEYVSRNGAYAGINGTYFCPASYASCAGKTNTFDLLVMNKDKYYFNSGNNVYSNNPAVIFGSGYIRFVTAASQWGRDTGADGVLSNYPLTVFNSQVNFGGDDDPKKGSKGGRSFVGNIGNTVYIGVVHNATVAEAGRVLQAMGMENALNLDNGGSTALYSGGYKVGPGRNLPNVILFVAK